MMTVDKNDVLVHLEDEIKSLQQTVLVKAQALLERARIKQNDKDLKYSIDNLVKYFDSMLSNANTGKDKRIFTGDPSQLEWVMMNIDKKSQAARECQLARIDLLKAQILFSAYQLALFVDDLVSQGMILSDQSERDLDQFKKKMHAANGTYGDLKDISIFRGKTGLEVGIQRIFDQLSSTESRKNLMAIIKNLEQKRGQLNDNIKTASLTPKVQQLFRQRLYMALPIVILTLVGLGFLGLYLSPSVYISYLLPFMFAGTLTMVVAPFYFGGIMASRNPQNSIWSMNESNLLKYFAADYQLQTSHDQALLKSLLPKGEEVESEIESSTRKIAIQTDEQLQTEKIKYYAPSDAGMLESSPEIESVIEAEDTSVEKGTYYVAAEEDVSQYPKAKATIVGTRGSIFYVDGQVVSGSEMEGDGHKKGGPVQKQ